MSSAPIISAIDSGDASKAYATLTAAFISDPLLRWVFPSADKYIEAFPKLLDAFGRPGLERGTVFSDSEFHAVSIWLPPGVEVDEERVGATLEAIVSADRLGPFVAVLDAMGKYHPHDEPLWFLPAIGVDPAGQGKGMGSALMQHALKLCDQQGTRAYLESSNPKNLTYYQRHGFEIMGCIEMPGAPKVYPMIRAKQ
jgi:ribosomal protein S18 acetylase RimI-like enzyme